jgi:ATP-dependent RNA helicase RhlE
MRAVSYHLYYIGHAVNFKSFGLHPLILATVEELGYDSPTPIQTLSLPPILAGKDVMGLAQTGSGKTAAFVLPMLQLLIGLPRDGVGGLIVAPTRELAQQIHESIAALAKGTKLRSLTLYGGVSINPQIEKLKQGVDIIVACPGRLLDHLRHHTLNLSKVKVLVLDEADQMFDMGFLPDIRKIVKHLPKQRQTLLFSATMPGAINDLAQQVLHNPEKIKIGHNAPSTSVKQVLFPVPQHLKTDLLIYLLNKINKESVLVFTRTKHTAKKVALKLEKAGFSSTSLQGNLSQNRRQSAMNGFRDGSLQILVATDIAARGIDVASISHVINFDIPSTVEAYIHRIGRTGRAAKTGEAFTLITPDDASEVRGIERVLGKKLEQCEFKDFNYSAPTQPSRPLMSVATHKPVHNRNRDSRDRDKSR